VVVVVATVRAPADKQQPEPCDEDHGGATPAYQQRVARRPHEHERDRRGCDHDVDDGDGDMRHWRRPSLDSSKNAYPPPRRIAPAGSAAIQPARHVAACGHPPVVDNLPRTIAYIVGVLLLVGYVVFITTGMARNPIASRQLALIAASLAVGSVVLCVSAAVGRRRHDEHDRS
jgi:hypothetical protein